MWWDGLTAFMVIMLGNGVSCLAVTLDPFVLFTAADAINKISNGAQIAISDGIIWRFIGWVILAGY
ncbi:arginine-ornithine APC transporter [Spiroplasma mirum ATCC 29335]|nr:arginine-ornithine APC transporter [Spiroplasma mirum ATCC 29335]